MAALCGVIKVILSVSHSEEGTKHRIRRTVNFDEQRNIFKPFADHLDNTTRHFVAVQVTSFSS